MKGKKRSRIAVAVNDDLVTDARVHRVCTSLLGEGYEPLLVGRLLRRGNLPVHRAYPTRRFPMWTAGGFFFYAEFNLRLLCTLLLTRTDAILCNDTDALIACRTASWLKRVPLIFDAHELFPELPEVVGRRWVRALWTKTEDLIFPHLRHAYTVCHSIADYYFRRYGLQMGVVRNIPPRRMQDFSEKVPPLPAGSAAAFPEKGRMKILLYQGAVNVGRGLEWIIDAMPLLDDCMLYVCGDGDCLQALRRRAEASPAARRIVFTGRIPHACLAAYTARADVGFVLLERLGLSYYYALPNRIFDYMRSGVPVVATEFPEIRRIVQESGSGVLTSRHDPAHLARLIRTLLAEWTPEKRQALRRKAEDYCWENEARTMLATVARALGRQRQEAPAPPLPIAAEASRTRITP